MDAGFTPNLIRIARRFTAKTIHRTEYRVLLKLLKEHRVGAGVTQADLSTALERSQSFMSDIERGVRRLDLVELNDICTVLKIGAAVSSDWVYAAGTAGASETAIARAVCCAGLVR